MSSTTALRAGQQVSKANCRQTIEKKIDLTQNVYQLTQTHPELISIMASLGFSEITKKGIRLSV